MTDKKRDYKSLMQELQSLLTEMQAESLDVDSAMARYRRGQQLITELKVYLETAENEIIKHQLPNKGKNT
jgi:exodeoxyribonuclease VII small subunit